eukprot:jgi/Hompol1/3971/HPOL_003419-RA
MAPQPQIIVPPELPLLRIQNSRVLLPGIVIRLQIVKPDSTALLDQLWSRFKQREPLVIGCVTTRAAVQSSTIKSNESKDTPKSNSPGDESAKPSMAQQRSRRLQRSFDPEIGDVSATPPVHREQLHEWGCVALILDLSKTNSQERRMTNVTYMLTLEGIGRFKIMDLLKTRPFLEASIQVVPEPDVDRNDMELQVLIQRLRAAGQGMWIDSIQYAQIPIDLPSLTNCIDKELSLALSQLRLPPTVINELKEMLNSTPPGQLADLFASMIDLSLDEKLEVLETVDLKERISKVVQLISRQIQVLKISQKLQTTIENKLGRKMREFVLREQLEAIKKELGEADVPDQDDETGNLSKKISEAKLPPEAEIVAQRELKRLKRMSPSMAEFQVIRTYLECLTELPWSKSTQDNLDIIRAREVLDADHHGLDRVKTRIVEYLAVRKLKQDLRGPIICFMGPPGVGKTSLGRSIANALGRKFHRISLGGVRDEAEIRGHRRTYIGAMPGLIIQGLRKCGVNNPVILLDEIDKLGRDFRGDPSAALLEVLDPEQNSTFSDHYVGIPFDLSNVIFIATANELDTIPAPLIDRMEMINIPGYTFDEKMHIARRHLLPKQISAHGLRAEHVDVASDVLLKIATGYTREAGVRNLEREIAAICRSLAVEYSQQKDKGREKLFDGTVTLQRLVAILGPEIYDDEVSERSGVPGVVTGLAWTATGSGGLLFIEVAQTPGKGSLHLTGKLGEVIKESAQISVTWVRANAERLDIRSRYRNAFEEMDTHIHFPAGAIPKDGPSAGVTITTALVSLLTGSLVRDNVAMTGEVTLRGQVLPVGGIKEKVLAAHRGGIRRVILPVRNRKDVEADVPENVKKEMEFVFVKNMWQVLRSAFADDAPCLRNAPTDEAVDTLQARL